MKRTNRKPAVRSRSTELDQDLGAEPPGYADYALLRGWQCRIEFKVNPQTAQTNAPAVAGGVWFYESRDALLGAYYAPRCNGRCLSISLPQRAVVRRAGPRGFRRAKPAIVILSLVS